MKGRHRRRGPSWLRVLRQAAMVWTEMVAAIYYTTMLPQSPLWDWAVSSLPSVGS
ncbi:hypothetical protein [Streptomyces prasinus]|uniref:hypothetical protein n=1 Tax=Streptomyces prasinus TaxID=67345 RepID=UPI0036A35630